MATVKIIGGRLVLDRLWFGERGWNKYSATCPSNRVPEGLFARHITKTTIIIIIGPTEHRPRPSSHPQICRNRIVCSGQAARASRAGSQTQGMIPELTEGLPLVDRLPRQPCGYDP